MSDVHRIGALTLIGALVALVGCGASAPQPATPAAPGTTSVGSSAAAAGRTSSHRRLSAVELETALRTNPSDEATSASCATATVAERTRARRAFGRARLQLFVCAIAVRGQRAKIFDVQVLRHGCFIAHRRTANQAVFGCIRR